jgi:RNA polymerase sigma factor (sigma-70 family)
MERSTADSDLVTAAIRGERAAFAALVERYHPMVCAVSYAATGDRALSEDVAQDAFIAAWSSLSDLRDASRLRPWLCGIARNLGHKALRAAGRETPIEPAETDELGGDDASPLDAMLDAETETLVWRALSQLPERNREAMVLYYREGETASEVAAALGITEDAVMQRLSRGRRQLRKRVSAIVERSLREARPSAGFVAAVVAALPGLGALPRAEAAASSPAAAPTTHGHGGTSMMIKIGIIAAATATIAGGGVWYASHDGEASGEPGAAATEDTRAATESVRPPALERGAAPAIPGEPGGASAPPTAGGPAPDWITTLQLPDGLGVDEIIEHRPFLDCARRYIGVAGELLIDLGVDGGKVASIALADRSEVKELSPAARRCLEAALVGREVSGGADGLQVRFNWRDDHRVPEQPDRELMRALAVEQGASRGPAGAPVSIVVFHDFACRFCATVLGTIDELFDLYPGKLRLVVKQYPVHEGARLAHEAVLAAADQGKFWPMHDRIMAHQDDLSEATLIAHAEQIGLDVARFRRDLAGHSFREAVQADVDQGVSMGVTGTPTFLINGKRVTGARPIDFFRAEIDAALSRL